MGSNTYSDAYVGTDASRRKTVPQSGISCPLLHGCLSPGQGAMPLALGPPALPALPAQGPARSIKSGGSHLGKKFICSPLHGRNYQKPNWHPPSSRMRGAQSPSLVCGPSKLNTLAGSPCLFGGRGAGRAMPSWDHACQQRGPLGTASWCPVAVPCLWPVKTKHFDGQPLPLRRQGCRPGDAFAGSRRWC